MKFRKTLVWFSAAILLMAAFCTNASAAGEAPRPKLTIGRFETAPTIDGSFSEAEWGTKSFTLAEGQPNVTVHKEKDGDKELPVTKTVTDVYLGYDETHFYMCVVANYQPHEAQALLGSKLWSDDCLQTKLSATEEGPNYNDIDFGLNTTTNRALAHVWNGHGVTYGQLSPGKGKDFMITRTGTKTVYEVSYPLKSFASNVLKLKEGNKMAFSIAQHMSKKGGFYEFAGGIVNSKEITSTAILTLGSAKNLPSSGKKSGSGGSSAGKNNGGTSSKNSQTANDPAGTVDGNKEETVSGEPTDNTDSDENGEAEVTETDSQKEDGGKVEVVEEVVEEKKAEKKAEDDKLFDLPVLITIGVCVLLLGVGFYFLILRKN